MSFKPGDRVVHKSDKTKTLVVAAQAVREYPPTNRHNELVNLNQVQHGSYYCTWISGATKGEAYFLEAELELAQN